MEVEYAIKHEIFRRQEFIEEFEKADKVSGILKDVPIDVVVNYDVDMYGARLTTRCGTRQAEYPV